MNDTIKRRDVVEAAMRIDFDLTDSDLSVSEKEEIKTCLGNMKEDFIQRVKTIPIATGTWQEVWDANEFGDPYPCGVACDKCGFIESKISDYCPNCGVRMKCEG